ncbi:MAG: CotH kinase family protein [Opitutaceae bacterium]|nr:CotH kinase family protein [Opitutaceae bacterium]
MKLQLLALFPAVLVAQPSPPGGGSGPFGPGGPGGRGPGFGPMMQETKLVAQFDRDGDKRLNEEERAAAREYHKANRAARGGPGGPGGRFPGRGRPNAEPPEAGVKLTPADVQRYGNEPLYATTTLRTLFLEFKNPEWEIELEDFNNTDVDVPATLAVDGKTYRDVGVHFRGASSYMMVSRGSKRSLNLTLDFADKEQHLLGHRTLNLLNSHGDASFSRAPLFSRIAQDYLPTPRVNFMRVVINGENWGIYAAAEQFNKDFLRDRFGSDKGARWKVPGSPGGRGGFAYLGDRPEDYKRSYEIKSKDDDASWFKLIRVCRLLEETPSDKLEAALAPYLDIDGALRFLALDTTFSNGDGFWTRTSDFSIGEDKQGRLHMIPHDMNETFSFGGGPGGRGGRGPGGPGGPPPGFGPPPDGARGGPPGGGGRGPGGGFPGGGGGPKLDPLAAEKNPNAALASKLLAVPELRARYLAYVRDMAEKWLDWSRLGPIAREYHDLIDADVKRDTRKLESYEDFQRSLESGDRSLKAFADQRRAFLLGHEAIKNLPR